MKNSIPQVAGFVLVFSLGTFAGTSAFAHGGGLNSDGCQ